MFSLSQLTLAKGSTSDDVAISSSISASCELSRQHSSSLIIICEVRLMRPDKVIKLS